MPKYNKNKKLKNFPFLGYRPSPTVRRLVARFARLVAAPPLLGHAPGCSPRHPDSSKYEHSFRQSAFGVLAVLAIFSFQLHAQTPFSNTLFAATPFEKILPGKNLVWCESFQQAWNLFGKEICAQAPKLQGAPEVASQLNLSFGKKPSIDPESLFLRAGEISPSFIEEINSSLKKRFGERAPTPLSLSLEQGFLVYAFLSKDLRFSIPFERQTHMLSFVDADGSALKVESFGIPEVNGSTDPKLVSQIGILYDVPGEYIVELKSKENKTRLILARTRQGDTLQTSIQTTLEQMRKARVQPSFPPQISDRVLIPRLALDTTRIFSELIGREILNPRTKDSVIRDARVSIKFALDEGGASVASEAKIRSVKNGHAPRRIVFDHPFLVLILNNGTHQPWFAAWVENAELFTASK